jgi:hypothetical protein
MAKIAPLKPSKPRGLVSPATVEAANTPTPVRPRGSNPDAPMLDPKKSKLGRKL